jgi:hypothetical protein
MGTANPYGLHIRKTDHNPPRGPSVGWWVYISANVLEIKAVHYQPINVSTAGAQPILMDYT